MSFKNFIDTPRFCISWLKKFAEERLYQKILENLDVLNELEQNVNFVQNLKYCLSKEKFRTTYVFLSMDEIRLNVRHGLFEYYERVERDPMAHQEEFNRRVEEGMILEIAHERLKTLTIFVFKIIEFGDIGT